MRKNTLAQRLNIIKGQIDGLSKIIDGEGTCKQVTEQFYAVNSGLKKVLELYFQENLDKCLKSVNSKQKESIQILLNNLIKNK